MPMPMGWWFYCLYPLALMACTTGSWSGPTVRTAFSHHGGLSALSIDGHLSSAGWLVGNTQGGLDDNYVS
jgi:hypothetical protein